MDVDVDIDVVTFETNNDMPTLTLKSMLQRKRRRRCHRRRRHHAAASLRRRCCDIDGETVDVDVAVGDARRDRDDRVGMGVIHVPRRYEGVKRRVDGGRPRVERKDAISIPLDHLVLGLGLDAALGA